MKTDRLVLLFLLATCSFGNHAFAFSPSRESLSILDHHVNNKNLQSLQGMKRQLTTHVHPASRSQQNSFSNIQTSTQLSMLPSTVLLSSTATNVASSLSSPIVSVTALAFVIVVHEAGHFIAARSMNINVKEFSVGVGPKIAGFTRTATPAIAPVSDVEIDTKSNQNSIFRRKNAPKENIVENNLEEDNSIDFSLRLIPLGGYVRFPDNYNRTEVIQMEQEEFEERRRARKEAKEKKKNNAVLLTEENKPNKLLTMFSFLDPKAKQREEERLLEEQRLKEEEEKAKKQWWKFNSNSKQNNEVGIKEEKKENLSIAYYEDPNLLQNRPWTQRAIVLVGGIVFNLLLAFSVYFGEVTIGKGLPSPVFEPGAIIRIAPKTASSAAYGILNSGDVIVGYNGNPMTLSKTSSTAIAQEEISKLISSIRATKPNEAIQLTVQLSTNKNSIPKTKDILLYPRAPIDPETGAYLSPPTIGVSLVPNYIQTNMVRANSVTNAFQLAGTALTDITTDTANSIGNAIYSMIYSSSKNPTSELSGPIGVIRMGSEIASSTGNDLGAIAAFAAAISVNLAVVNALPLPALDGGQLVFVLLEGLAGRKVVDQETEERINAGALFLILFVSFSTAVGDIGAIVVGR